MANSIVSAARTSVNPHHLANFLVLNDAMSNVAMHLIEVDKMSFRGAEALAHKMLGFTDGAWTAVRKEWWRQKRRDAAEMTAFSSRLAACAAAFTATSAAHA
jgi:hypothetical protein